MARADLCDVLDCNRKAVSWWGHGLDKIFAKHYGTKRQIPNSFSVCEQHEKETMENYRNGTPLPPRKGLTIIEVSF